MSIKSRKTVPGTVNHNYAPAAPCSMFFESGERSLHIGAGTVEEFKNMVSVALSFKEVQTLLGFKEEETK